MLRNPLSSLIVRIVSTALISAWLVSACAPGSGAPASSSSSGLIAWLDQPSQPDGTVLPMAPFTLKAHARGGSSGGVSQIVFLVNSIAIGSVDTDPSQPLVYGEVAWNPSAPGEYLIQAQAVGGAGAMLSDGARVCVVSGSAGEEACGALVAGQEAVTETIILTKTVGTEQPKTIDFKVGGIPDPVYAGQCLKGEPQSINFEGYATDTSGAIEVDMRLFLQNYAGSRQELALLPMTPAGNNNYTASYDLSGVDPKPLENQQGSLVFTMQLLDANKNFYASSPEQVLSLFPCVYEAAQQPVVTTPPPQQPPQQPPPVITTEPPPPPPQDTTPPNIKGGQPSVDVVYFDTYGKGCDAKLPTSVSVSAKITDDSGVSQANIYWYYTKTMDPYSAYSAFMSSSGNTWSYTLTPDHADDTLAYWIEAWDIYNNHSSTHGATGVAVVGCQPPQ